MQRSSSLVLSSRTLSRLARCPAVRFNSTDASGTPPSEGETPRKRAIPMASNLGGVSLTKPAGSQQASGPNSWKVDLSALSGDDFGAAGNSLAARLARTRMQQQQQQQKNGPKAAPKAAPNASRSAQKATSAPQRRNPSAPTPKQNASAPAAPRVSIKQLGSLHVPDLTSLQLNRAPGQARGDSPNQAQRGQGQRQQTQRRGLQGADQGQRQQGRRQQDGSQLQTGKDQRAGSQRSLPGRGGDSRPKNGATKAGGQRLTPAQRAEQYRRTRQQPQEEEEVETVDVNAATNYHIDLGDMDMFGAAAEDTATRAAQTALAVRASSPIAGIAKNDGPRTPSAVQRIREAAAGDYSRRLPASVIATLNVGALKPDVHARAVMGRNPTMSLAGRNSAASIIRKAIPPPIVTKTQPGVSA